MDDEQSLEEHDNNHRVVMEYQCECGEAWTDMWFFKATDFCPNCDKEVDPSSWEDITLEPPGEEK